MSPRRLIRYAGFDPTECSSSIVDPNKPRKPCGRVPKLITFDGKSMSIRDWADHLGQREDVLRQRLKNWELERALTTPPRSKRLEPAKEEALPPAKTWSRGSPPRLITYDGQTRTLQEWADLQGISKFALIKRLKNWPIHRALTTRKLEFAECNSEQKSCHIS